MTRRQRAISAWGLRAAAGEDEILGVNGGGDIGRSQVTTAADLDAAAVHDVLLSIYRPLRPHPVEAMRLTFSLELLLFRPA